MLILDLVGINVVSCRVENIVEVQKWKSGAS